MLLFVFFGVVKGLNARLHTMFDTQDCIEEEEDEDEDEENQILDDGEDDDDPNNANVREGKKALNASGGGRNLHGPPGAHRHQDPEAGIEMQVRLFVWLPFLHHNPVNKIRGSGNRKEYQNIISK